MTALKPGDKVWIVLEGPDMSYYGTAEIHGVHLTEEGAKARLAERFPNNSGQDFESQQVEEHEVEA